jgi:hypothetical protein
MIGTGRNSGSLIEMPAIKNTKQGILLRERGYATSAREDTPSLRQL